MEAVTLAEAKQNLDGLIKRAISHAEPTIIRTESGEEVIFLALDEFRSWQETIYLLSSPANAEHLQKSILEADSGRFQQHELVDP
jgi:antitoxin YefM